jgi:hypothetical protein
MQAIVDLKRLANRTLLCTGAHSARRNPVGVTSLDVDTTDRTADSFLPVVNIYARKSVTRYSRVEERVRDVEHRTLN